MARKVLVRLVDDLDGLPSEGVATVTFSLDRVTYQIDLNESNASKLRDGLAGFIAAARRTGGRVKRGAAGGRAAANDGPMIREWARKQGHQLAERGRIPSHIVDEYRTATGNGARAKVTEVAPVRAPRKLPAKTAAASRSAAVATTATATTRGARTRTAPAKTAAQAAPKTSAKAAPKPTARTAAKATAAKTTARTTAAKATTAKTAPAKAAPKAAPKATAKATDKAADKTAKKTPAAKTPAAKTPRSAAKTPRTTASTAAGKPAQRTRRAPASKTR
jgi:hypothetical protein